VERGISPERILGVTFTNKAAREMQERVGKLIPKGQKGAARGDALHTGESEDGQKPLRPTICTFHSLCVRILRQHIEKLAYKRNFVIYDESEQLSAIKKILSHVSAKGQKIDPGPILARLSKIKNAADDSGIPTDDETAVARHIRPRYESALRACNAVD